MPKIHQYHSNIDTEELYHTCLRIQDDILNKWSTSNNRPVDHDTGEYYNFFNVDRISTTDLYKNYNLFVDYVEWGDMSDVRDAVISSFKQYCSEPGEYLLYAWLNVYHAGEYIDWHGHTTAEDHHGYFTVNGNNTVTSYRWIDENSQDVQNSNGTIVLGPSGTDEHRTYPWEDESKFRITLAYDFSKVPLNRTCEPVKIII